MKTKNEAMMISDLVEVGALGRPQRSSSKTQDQSSGDESVELGVELRRHVGGVAEHAHHQGPLHLQVLDEDGGHEHAGEDEAGVHRSAGPGAQVGSLVDGGLELAQVLEGEEQQEEGARDEEKILVDDPLLPLPLLCCHVLIWFWRILNKQMK